MIPLQRLVLFAMFAAACGSAVAAESPASGFYGGITRRDNGAEQGLFIGDAGNASRFSPVLVDGRATQSLVFGGYRWRNDLALEAALGSADDYRLTGRGGVGLALPVAAAPRSWNLDLYGTWSFWRSLALYGRLGYAQSDYAPTYGPSMAGLTERRSRDGINYGVGLRYDIGRSLGLKLEYARATPHGDYGASLPEGDQVQFGLQFRF
ncbi:MAG TPA: outer membrane beta-barrel protein [Casimicrobiaceae bacterium]|nr:outer membrane beta-barrel protein [Casimicrobiaceae bacterium]